MTPNSNIKSVENRELDIKGSRGRKVYGPSVNLSK